MMQRMIRSLPKRLSRLTLIGMVLLSYSLAYHPVSADDPTPTPTPAPSILVNSTADDSGACPDACTLRSAITNANSGDLIGFAATVKGTILLTATLMIDKDLTIQGPGASILAIDGGKNVTIFTHDAGHFNISGLTLQSGKTSDPADGGAIHVSRSSALTVTNCVFNGNAALNQGGAIYGEQGSGVTIFNSTFTGNQAQGFGGAIFNNGGSLDITNSTFSGNIANFVGGGIANHGGDLTIMGSTFSKNVAGRYGGALEYSAGNITILNSSFANNATTSASGGALSDDETAAQSLVRISFSTIAFNSASSGRGGGINTLHATVTLNGSIVAQNTAQSSPDIYGKLKSGGYNLIGNSNNVVGTVSSDLGDIDPLLMPLALNAPGTTPTLALQPTSPILLRGGTACPETDQRGVLRKKTCDIGAYETETKK